MNKKLLFLAIGILALLLAMVTYLIMKPSGEPVRNVVTKTNDTKKYVVKKACDILTSEDAKKLFDTENVTTTPEDNTGEQSTDIATSSCAYSNKTKMATILVRSAKNDAGQATIKTQFTQKRPVNTQDVSNYGDAAYWNLQLGQLNIIKGNTWYILSFGPMAINQRTLGDSEQLAKQISSKLDYAPGESY